MLVKAFGSKANKNISNLAKAQLILSIIITVLAFIIGIAFTSLIVSYVGNAFGESSNSGYNYNDSYYSDSYYNFD